MKNININLPQNGYNVFLGDGIFNQLLKKSKSLKLNKNLFFAIDSNVYTFTTGSTPIDDPVISGGVLIIDKTDKFL